MPTDHRGRPIGNPFTSHGGQPVRTQPRLVANISRLYGISNDDAQGVLDNYKNKIDIGDNGYSGGPTDREVDLINKLGTSKPGEVLDDTFYNRHMADGALDQTMVDDGPSEPRPYWGGVPH
jgi:hypothetical protein